MKLFEPLTVGTLRLKNRTVVLACGDHARTDLHASLPGRVPELHLVGDAWAPRRLTIVTREGWELGRRL